MKTIFISIIAALTLGCSGCSTIGTSSASKNATSFLAGLPAITATNITQETDTPFYSHSEVATGVNYDPTSGLFTVTGLEVKASIPELGSTIKLSIAGISFKATPAQIAAAQALLVAPPAK